MAAKGCGVVGEKVREVTEEMRFGIWWVLKEDQYLDSGVCLGVLGLGFSLGFTGLKLELGSAIEGGLWKLRKVALGILDTGTGRRWL